MCWNKVLFLEIYLTLITCLTNGLLDECSMMVCRSGRECKLNGNGEASCVCMATCPDHFVPVCGSNGQSYDNYCMMHRDACLSDVHISLKKKGYCSDKDTSSSTSTHEQEQSFFEPGSYHLPSYCHHCILIEKKTSKKYPGSGLSFETQTRTNEAEITVLRQTLTHVNVR